MIDEIKNLILRNKGLIIIILVISFLLVPSVFAHQSAANFKKSDVLGLAAKTDQQITNPQIDTPTPVPTVAPILTSTPTLVPTSTPTPTPSQGNAPTATPTPTQQSNDPTPTPTLIPTATPTQDPTPTPTGLSIKIGVDYAGQRTNDSYTATFNAGQTAWDAVSSAVGINNLQYTDYGGDMGIFITGFNGINASPKQYFEFRVNGVSSNVGVSSYKCNDGDRLDFVLTSF